jgi:tetratricopeptide (TPR) repeat protein
VLQVVGASITVAALALGSPPSGADGHLLAGARHFREGRFAEALVEFKVARRLGAEGPAAWYASAALVKLGRHEEAVEGFAAAERLDPASGDALLGYYRALALYGARLYTSADAMLARIGDGAGPRIGAQVAELRGRIGALLSRAPATSSIDWYHERGREVERARPLLAAALYAEAASLAELRTDGHRRDEAVAALRRVAGGETSR